jgi:iron complex outermembrane recepter protein
MLGGAINFITPTAYTAIAPNILRLDGGSFGTIRGNAQLSRVLGNFDFLVNGTVTHADGHRDHQTTQSETLNANFGYRFTPTLETRFYGGAFIVDQELAGSLSLDDALNNPTIATKAALSGDQARNTKTIRVANRTSLVTANGKLDIDSWGIHKNLFHPVSQVIDQDGWTYGIGSRYSSIFQLSGFRNELLVGARFFGGNNTALQYLNNGGSRGAQTLESQQNAYNYEAYFENRFWFVPNIALMTGAKLFHAERIYQDRGGLALNSKAKQDHQEYSGINPKLGLLWQPKADIQAFIDITRSQDVPDFSDLTQTTAATARFVPLKVQDAWTLELGTRGKHGRYSWDVTAYRSWVKNELMQFTTNSTVPAATFNAGNTLHQGVEFGATAELLQNIISSSDTLTLSQIWNFSDFHFQNDRQYGNNQIAGVPQHRLRTELSYKHRSGLYFTPNVDWVPQGTYADQANTQKAPSYVLLDLKTGIEFDNGLLFYVDARNLTDQRYVSEISTVKDARTTTTSIFQPGTGRSVFAGIRYSF